MVIKYTTLKVLTQNLSRVNNSKTGFTLIELIVGLLIMLIVGGLAMNAFIQASQNFSDDKKTIDSSQNLSAVLEIIGNDVRQSGEQINEANFPVIKIEVVPVGDIANKPGSSKITIRRALTPSLTLCEDIAATNPIASNTLIVADNVQTNSNCKVGTLSTTSLPAASGNISRPTSLKEGRNYRCKLDNINADYTVANTDFCQLPKATVDQEKVLAAMSDQQGNIRTFRYINDNEVTANAQYTISLEPGSLSASTPVNTGTYSVGSPIYLIEERIYTLGNDGNVKLQIDGGNVETLIKGIESFNVSARVYGDKTTKAPDPIDRASAAPVVVPSILPSTRRCNAATPYYICDFNSTTVDDWKTLQGIKVELQAKYDATGRSATASTNDTDKLSAKAEFFPRNVLSK